MDDGVLGPVFRNVQNNILGYKNNDYMEEVLRKILPLFSYLEGHIPIFT
jgi:hypothetical protein